MCSGAYPEAPRWPMLSTGASSRTVRAGAALPVEAFKMGAAVGEQRSSSLHPTPVCELPVLEGSPLLPERSSESARTSLRRSFRDGPRLVLLDHGLTLALDPSFVTTLDRIVSAMREGNLDALTGAFREAGLPVDEDTDLDTLLQLVGVLLGGEWEEIGTDFEGFGRRLGASVRDIPPRLLLVGRAISLLDGITRQLDPDVDALEIVARYTRRT